MEVRGDAVLQEREEAVAAGDMVFRPCDAVGNLSDCHKRLCKECCKQDVAVCGTFCGVHS